MNHGKRMFFYQKGNFYNFLKNEIEEHLPFNKNDSFLLKKMKSKSVLTKKCIHSFVKKLILTVCYIFVFKLHLIFYRKNLFKKNLYFILLLDNLKMPPKPVIRAPIKDIKMNDKNEEGNDSDTSRSSDSNENSKKFEEEKWKILVCHLKKK